MIGHAHIIEVSLERCEVAGAFLAKAIGYGRRLGNHRLAGRAFAIQDPQGIAVIPVAAGFAHFAEMGLQEGRSFSI